MTNRQVLAELGAALGIAGVPDRACDYTGSLGDIGEWLSREARPWDEFTVNMAFAWEDQPEGVEFWSIVHDRLEPFTDDADLRRRIAALPGAVEELRLGGI